MKTTNLSLIAIALAATVASCRTGTESRLTSVNADQQIAFRSLARTNVLRLDSIFSRFDFETDSLTITFNPLESGSGDEGIRSVKVTAHNLRGRGATQSFSQESINEEIADSARLATAIEREETAERSYSANPFGWEMATSFVIFFLLTAIIWWRRK